MASVSAKTDVHEKNAARIYSLFLMGIGVALPQKARSLDETAQDFSGDWIQLNARTTP
jgi:hypothetical protein